MRLQSLRVASTWQKKYDENAHEGVATELIAQVPHVNHVRRHYPNKPTNKKNDSQTSTFRFKGGLYRCAQRQCVILR